jgi:hypothetical protein
LIHSPALPLSEQRYLRDFAAGEDKTLAFDLQRCCVRLNFYKLATLMVDSGPESEFPDYVQLGLGPKEQQATALPSATTF